MIEKLKKATWILRERSDYDPITIFVIESDQGERIEFVEIDYQGRLRHITDFIGLAWECADSACSYYARRFQFSDLDSQHFSFTDEEWNEKEKEFHKRLKYREKYAYKVFDAEREEMVIMRQIKKAYIARSTVKDSEPIRLELPKEPSKPGIKPIMMDGSRKRFVIFEVVAEDTINKYIWVGIGDDYSTRNRISVTNATLLGTHCELSPYDPFNAKEIPEDKIDQALNYLENYPREQLRENSKQWEKKAKLCDKDYLAKKREEAWQFHIHESVAWAKDTKTGIFAV